MDKMKLVNLELSNLVIAYALILVAFGLARLLRIGQERLILVASLRMALQLIVVGYLLQLVFAVKTRCWYC